MNAGGGQQQSFTRGKLRGAEQSDKPGQNGIGKANLISYYGARSSIYDSQGWKLEHLRRRWLCKFLFAVNQHRRNDDEHYARHDSDQGDRVHRMFLLSLLFAGGYWVNRRALPGCA